MVNRMKHSGGVPERARFTKEMRSSYTILLPDMAPIHMELLKAVFRQNGYRLEVLTNEGQQVVEEGLKYVHNDTCYPALLVIGQMIDALKSGKYDVDRTALMITQTGGGCRASNYIHLLRKALSKAGMEQVPVVALGFSGLEHDSGFRLTPLLLITAAAALLYGDLLMLLHNQVRPYEMERGASFQNVTYWVEYLTAQFERHQSILPGGVKRILPELVRSFQEIPRREEKKLKVGIVGEIYVKYASLGNNHLEEFLESQNCEVMVPGLLHFMLYASSNPRQDRRLYGGGFFKMLAGNVAVWYIDQMEKLVVRAMEGSGFVPPASFRHLQECAQTVIGLGTKMGEGWLLPAEMVELVESGYENIVCAQPFGCLPNHIVGKGMIRKIRELHPGANIVPIDYDPGATRVNQENRIKLMLAVARERLEERTQASVQPDWEPAHP